MSKRRGNGEGTITQLANGTWRGSIQFGWNDDGKLVRKYCERKTRGEVVEALQTLKQKHAEGQPINSKDLTVGHYLREWLEDTIKRNKAPLTYRGYEQTARMYLLPHLGKIRLDELTGRDVQRMLNRAVDKGLSPGSVLRINATLKSALMAAKKMGLVSRNAAVDATPPKQVKYQASPLNAKQADKLLSVVAGDRFEAAFYLALMMGLRRGEVSGLRWSDIEFNHNFTAGLLHVRNSLQRLPKQGIVLGALKSKSSRRDPPIPKLCIDALLRRQMIQQNEKLAAGTEWVQDDDFVFTSRYGRRITIEQLPHELNAALKRAGLPHVRFHDLRHSAASLLLAKRLPMKVIQAIMGHANYQITADLYAHLEQSALIEAMETMNDIFDNTSQNPLGTGNVGVNVGIGKSEVIN